MTGRSIFFYRSLVYKKQFQTKRSAMNYQLLTINHQLLLTSNPAQRLRTDTKITGDITQRHALYNMR